VSSAKKLIGSPEKVSAPNEQTSSSAPKAAIASSARSSAAS
jgi:hypothetical protein